MVVAYPCGRHPNTPSNLATALSSSTSRRTPLQSGQAKMDGFPARSCVYIIAGSICSMRSSSIQASRYSHCSFVAMGYTGELSQEGADLVER
jgi:hypothetical protein